MIREYKAVDGQTVGVRSEIVLAVKPAASDSGPIIGTCMLMTTMGPIGPIRLTVSEAVALINEDSK